MNSIVADGGGLRTTETNGLCQKHGYFTQKLYKLPGGTEVKSFCPKCEEIKQQEIRSKEQSKQQAVAFIPPKKAPKGVPLRFAECSFENYEATTPGQVKALATCKDFAEDYAIAMRAGKSLILSGNVGTGKTHLACAIANTVAEQGFSVTFVRVVAALRAVKDTFGKRSTRTEQEVINDYVRRDLLILDEAGVQFGSEAERLIIFEIINERYENMKPTVIVSNLGLQGLRECLGERVIDRLRENGGEMVPFMWESHRK